MIIENSAFLDSNSLSKEAIQIVEKIIHHNRITPEDALYLFQFHDLSFLSQCATIIKRRKSDKYVYFNKNFHLEPTNVCLYSCSFCSYSKLIKERKDGWELSLDEMMNLVKKFDQKDVTEIHIVGGVMPQYDLQFYINLFKEIKAHRPSLHIKALTPVEYHYIFKKAKLSTAEGFKLLIDAGLDSLPGGGAEIFHSDIRKQIAPDKCTGQEWLDIHKEWHMLGKKSNATMLYGHIENYIHRIDHLDKLRNLQDETNGFQTFIPLKFLNENNEMSKIPMSTFFEDMKMYAVSRIYLDNFDHVKAYWPMLGKTETQQSLLFGVDDLDGTIDDTTKIYSMAGAEEQNPTFSTSELAKLIIEADHIPVERDTLYNKLRIHETIETNTDINSYLSLPVLNSNN